MRGRKPGQQSRVFPCWPAPPTHASQCTQPSNRLLCIPSADVRVNHSPQQKQMIFVSSRRCSMHLSTSYMSNMIYCKQQLEKWK